MYSLLSSVRITGSRIFVLFVILVLFPAACCTAQPCEMLYSPTVLLLLPLLLIQVCPPVQQWEMSTAMLDSPFTHLVEVLIFSLRELKQSCVYRGWSIPEGHYANSVSSVPQKGSEEREKGCDSKKTQYCNLHLGVKFPL